MRTCVGYFGGAFFDQVAFLYKCLWKGFKGGLLCICIWPLPKFIFWKGLKSVSDPLPSPRKTLSCVGSLANPLPPQFHEQSVPLNVPMMLPNAPTCCTVSFDNDTFIQLFNTFIPMMPANRRTCTVMQFRVKYFTWNSVTLQIKKMMITSWSCYNAAVHCIGIEILCQCVSAQVQ